MILTLRQFLENTDAGKEEWCLEPYFPSNLKLQNCKIKERFWQNYGYLYEYYVMQIILSTHEVWLSKEYRECRIYENYEVDREATINLLKQISVLNNNQYSQIELYQLRSMARWHNIIEFNGKGNQKSVINDKYDFTVKSWYIIGETLFVERMTNDIRIDKKHKTLLNVITKYYNNEVVCDGMIIEKDDKCFYCPWSSIERVSKYYKHEVIDVEKQANYNMLHIKLASSKGECNYNMKKNHNRKLKTYLEKLKLNEQIIFTYENTSVSCNVIDVLNGEYAQYAKCDVISVKYDDKYKYYVFEIDTNTNDDSQKTKKDIDDREKELHDIIGMMCSEDYQDRFKAEYVQLKMRYNKLYNMIIKYEAGKLNFKPKCDIELLKRQKAAMGQYLYYLEVRAEIEGIDINE